MSTAKFSISSQEYSNWLLNDLNFISPNSIWWSHVRFSSETYPIIEIFQSSIFVEIHHKIKMLKRKLLTKKISLHSNILRGQPTEFYFYLHGLLLPKYKA